MQVIPTPSFIDATVSPTAGNPPLTVTWHVDLKDGVGPFKVCWGMMTPQSDGTIAESVFYTIGQSLTQSLNADGTYTLVSIRYTDANGVAGVVAIAGGPGAPIVKVGSSGSSGGLQTNGCA